MFGVRTIFARISPSAASKNVLMCLPFVLEKRSQNWEPFLPEFLTSQNCFSRLNRLELTEASTSELWLFGAFN